MKKLAFGRNKSGLVIPLGKNFQTLSCMSFLGIVSILFLLVFSSYTSPLYPGYSGWDSGFFMYAGREIVRGKIPYVDFFDMKGPIIFLINALGVFLYDGRFGVFMVQIPFLFVAILMMYKTARLFVGHGGAIISVMLSLLCLSVTFGLGNLTEEYSLPFIMLCIYIACRFLKDDKSFSPLSGYAFGLSFAFLAFMRINNAVMIGASALYIFILLIFRKETKRILITIVTFFAGVLTVCVPIFTYFLANGAFRDMLYGTFVIPYLYAAKGITIRTAGSWMQTLNRALPVFFALVISAIYWKTLNKHIGRLMCFASALTVITLLFGFNYPHYYTLTIPAFLVGVAMSIQLLKGYREEINALTGVLLAAALLIGLSGFIHYINYGEAEYTELLDKYITKNYLRINEEYVNQASVIPEDDADSVLAYQTPSSWYFITGLSASSRYCAFQETFINLDEKIKEEMVEMLENDPPKWIVSPKANTVANYNLTFPELKHLLKTKYEFVSATTQINLYRRIAED